MPAYCNFCGAELPPTDRSDDCPACHLAFQADVAAGKIPTGLPKEGYKFWVWKAIGQCERDVNAKRKTMPEAQREVAQIVANAKKTYENIQETLELERQAMAEREKERSGPVGFLLP